MTHTAPVVVAEADPALSARIVRRHTLRYEAEADPSLDRPAHVRAASGIAFVGDELVVIQDDASFLAIGVPGAASRHVVLPAAPSGRRQFAEKLGNKADKPDLEACVLIPGPHGERLLALGSGSKPARESFVVYDPAAKAPIRVFDASALYAALRQDVAFSSKALNVEGAVVVGDVLRLFQRGNGDDAEILPVPATIDLPLDPFLKWLDGATTAPPPPRDVVRYALGERAGGRFGFTDATVSPSGRVLFLASAERSPDTYHDGEITGARVGIIEKGAARFTELLDENGDASPIKAEGLALDPADPRRAWVVLDADDPDRPSELCEVRLEGEW